MEFEFDPEKSSSNLAKHGIDFVEAQHLWFDARRVEIRARTQGEERWLLIARHASCHWSAAFTYREGRTRIISVRRARVEEVKIYEE